MEVPVAELTSNDFHISDKYRAYANGAYVDALGHILVKFTTLSGENLGKVIMSPDKTYEIVPLDDIVELPSDIMHLIYLGQIVPLSYDVTTITNFKLLDRIIEVVQDNKKVRWDQIVWNKKGIPTELTLVFSSVTILSPKHADIAYAYKRSLDNSHYDTIYTNFANTNDFFCVRLVNDSSGKFAFMHKSKFPSDWDFTKPLDNSSFYGSGPSVGTNGYLLHGLVHLPNAYCNKDRYVLYRLSDDQSATTSANLTASAKTTASVNATASAKTIACIIANSSTSANAIARANTSVFARVFSSFYYFFSECVGL